MHSLMVSESLKLPVDLVTDTVGILAIKGSGKTYTFLVFAEEMIKQKLPVVILDTMGVCWGIRASADGTGPGLTVTILGGTHGDVPIEAGAGKVIADWIVSDRQPTVLDISEFSKGEASRFILDLTTRLFQINREPVHLMIDEADEWIPQRPFREEARTLRAFEVLVKRGRARGIGVTLVTQRPATLNKNVLSQVGCLIVGRMIAPQDRKAVQAWIDAHGTEKQKEDFWDSLATLSTKEKWVWAPARDIFKKVLIRPRETFDSSKTPEVGTSTREPKSMATVDLEALKKKIASTIERAKQEDPRELRKQLAEITKLYHQALGRSTEKVEVPVEIPVLKDAQITRLEKIVENLRNIGNKFEGPIGEMVNSIGLMAKQGISITEAIKKYSSRPAIVPQKIETKANPALVNKYQRGVPSEQPTASGHIIKEEGDETPRALRSGERRMLDVLCRWYPARLTKAQLATLSRLRVTSGTFSNYYGTLKRANLIDEGANGIQVSELGLQIHGGIKSVPQTTEEIIQMWRGALRAGERRLLDILVEIYPKGISRSELAERTELTANAGTFSNYFGTLRRNGLAEVSGNQVRAGEALFLQK